MRTTRVGLEACPALDGAVVVVDVLRSFTTAALAFAAGAAAMIAVRDDAHARELMRRHPGALTLGSLPGGVPAPGFDLPNSPSALADIDLRSRTLLMSTAGGFRALIDCRRAGPLLATSMACARPTARWLRQLAPPSVTFVITGVWTDRDGDEDHACADYIEAMLRAGEASPCGHRPPPGDPGSAWRGGLAVPAVDRELPVDPAPYEARVRESDFGRRFRGAPGSPLPLADLDCCARADQVDFALVARRTAGEVRLAAVSGGDA